jgi:transitional endoplasmic reticulum ATPase
VAITAIVDPQPSDYREARLCAAHLDADLMEALDVQAGDLLRVSTQRGRAALVRVIAPLAQSPKGSLRFDRFTRQALKAFPHEEVSLEKVESRAVKQIILIPGIDMSMRYNPTLVPELKKVLAADQAPVRPGMLLYIRLADGLAGITYEVHDVLGDEGMVTNETAIYLEYQHEHDHGPNAGHQHEHQRQSERVVDTTYEDVGGLNEQIAAVREFVELPLIFPQVYRQLGITPPRGVIFYGAPGTGKTLLARSVANEINAKFYYINGPEIVGTYGGQTEENLRKIFGDASMNPPAIIFIDELDAIAPIRGTTTTLGDTRAVTQLLALMDGLNRAEGVMVVGTTNRVDSIDPALRRAGRFDREVHFPTPSPEGREQILRVHTREMPLTDEAIDAIPEFARRAYGYVGADLMELSREAGLNALRRASRAFIDSPSVASYPSSEDLVVTRADFDAALARVRPAAMRESLMSFPNVTWGDVGGMDSIKSRLRDLIEKPLRRPRLFARLGLATNLGVLLYGPPGTGKTLLAKAIARESGVNFIAIQGPELFSQWLGESEESVRHVFNVARRAAPCIIFFDQLDAIAPLRTDADHEGTRAPQRVVNQLLSELDGMEQLSQVIVVGATNKVSMVDPAVLRPGRFGVHLHVGLPNEDDRAAILGVHLRGATLAPDQSLPTLVGRLVAMTAGFSGADLAFLTQRAKLQALDEVGYDGLPALSLQHFESVVGEFGHVPEHGEPPTRVPA